jgi:hypothetical protein
MLALAAYFRRNERAHAWPLMLAGQFYTLLAIAQTVLPSQALLVWLGWSDPGSQAVFSWQTITEPIPVGLVLVQISALLYYSGSSWFMQHYKWIARFFVYAAAILAYVAYTFVQYGNLLIGKLTSMGYAWLVFAGLMLGVGALLDWFERKRNSETRVGFGHGAFFVGYVLLAHTIFWTWPTRLVNLVVLGAAILLSLGSHISMHMGWHDTWDEFAGLFAKINDTSRMIVRSAFLWIGVYAFPIWLATLLAYQHVPWAWRGLALALTAPLFIAFGLAVKRIDATYSWSLFSAGYLLTAVAAMISFDDQLLAMYVLSLNVVVYAVSAYIFRQAAWLYFSTVLIPIISLMVLDHNLGNLPAVWVSAIFMGLAYLYFLIGRWFDTRLQDKNGVASAALAFYAPGFLLSALAIAAASSQRDLAIVVYLAGSVLYALAARAFKESVFLYPAVWLIAVPYYLGMTYTRLHPTWYGIGWLPLIVTSIAVGKIFFHKKHLWFAKGKDLFFWHAAIPFYSLAYFLSLSMIFIARTDLAALTTALGLAAMLYLGSAWLFKRFWWLYPGLLSAHLSLFTLFAMNPGQLPIAYVAVAYLPLTYLTGILGARLWRDGHSSWAFPLLIFAVVDVILWQIVALPISETGIVVAGGHAILIGIITAILMSQQLVWTALAFLLLAFGYRLAAMNLALPDAGVIVAGVGFGMYLVGRLTENLAGRVSQISDRWSRRSGTLRLWEFPIARTGMVINLIGAVSSLGFILSHTTQASLGLAFVGATYLAVAYQGHYHYLGYAAVAVLEIAMALLFWRWDLEQPQFYAIPAGLYFIAIAWFEKKRDRVGFAKLLESFGLLVILLTAFLQSLNLETGFWYFVLLLVEGVLMMVWGAQQRRKLPFLIGVGGNVMNVVGQIVVLFLGGSTLTRWIIFGGVGLLILLAAIYAERWILPRAQQLRERLEAWT